MVKDKKDKVVKWGGWIVAAAAVVPLAMWLISNIVGPNLALRYVSKPEHKKLEEKVLKHEFTSIEAMQQIDKRVQRLETTIPYVKEALQRIEKKLKTSGHKKDSD